MTEARKEIQKMQTDCWPITRTRKESTERDIRKVPNRRILRPPAVPGCLARLACSTLLVPKYYSSSYTPEKVIKIEVKAGTLELRSLTSAFVLLFFVRSAIAFPPV